MADMAMAIGKEHIVKSFDEELKRLRQAIAQMGGLVEAQLQKAVDALVKRDSMAASQVIADDKKIDELEEQVSNLVIRLLALRQPMANDLRHIVSALKISSDLERIGDYAKNVAKRAVALAQFQPVKPVYAIPRMAKLVQEMIKEILDAYTAQDAAKAVAAWQRDEEVDEMYTSLFRELLTYMMEDARAITPCTHLLFMAKNLERIGDHATNIAENIWFLIHGEELMPPRDKRDDSSTTVV
jgi:phosphate transport system protein